MILACALLLLPAAAARAADDAQLHGTITPPGADSRHATAEIAAYDDLVQGYPSLTEEELRTRYFKQRIFGDSQDSDDPAAWQSDAEAERIRFLPAATLSMHWVNRPTTQQIALFGRLRERPKLRLKVRCIGRRARARVVGPDRARVLRVRYRRARRVVRAKVTMRSGKPRKVRLKRQYRPCSGRS